MTDPTGAVAILPNAVKLGWQPGTIPLDDLIWPCGQPRHLQGRPLGDLGPDDHLVVFARDTLHIRPSFGTRAKVSLLLMEPRAIHGHHLKLLRLTHRRFHRVLCTDEALLAAIPNGVFFPFGSTWVPGWQSLDLAKSRHCSLIASAKRSQDGHVLRHAIADWTRAEGCDVDLMGGGYAPFGDKAEGLAPYRFSVVIENVAERNYFTEKLIDAILCDCVPVYWGCPNIADFLDTSGMILCHSEADLRAAITSLSEHRYHALLPALQAAKPAAARYGDIFTRAAEAVRGAPTLSPQT